VLLSTDPAMTAERRHTGADPTTSWAGNLRILTSGPLPPNPGEMVASRKIASIFQELANGQATYILVDAPPILGFGDAAALSAWLDGLLMVVNVSKTRRPTLVEAREQLEALPCRKVGAIVVGQRADRESSYAYGDGYRTSAPEV